MNLVDPSGHFTINETAASIANQLNIAYTYIARPLQLYSRIKNGTDVLFAIKSVFDMVVDGQVADSIRDGLRQSKEGVMKDLSIDHVMADLQNNLFSRVAPAVLRHWPMALASAKQMPQAIGISMPVPFPMPKLPPVKLGKIPKTDWDLYLIFGASGTRWGRVLGMEFLLPTYGWQEVWRMDYHSPHEEPQDFRYWKSAPFHYHVKSFAR